MFIVSFGGGGGEKGGVFYKISMVHIEWSEWRNAFNQNKAIK